jgi:hypothetical protein
MFNIKKQITKVNKKGVFILKIRERANKPVNTFPPTKIKRRKVYFLFSLCQRQAKFGHTVRVTCRRHRYPRILDLRAILDMRKDSCLSGTTDIYQQLGLPVAGC